MSNGYDYFGGASRPPNAPPREHSGAPDRQGAVDRWGMPVGGPPNLAAAATATATATATAPPLASPTAPPAAMPPPDPYSGFVGYSPPPVGYTPQSAWPPPGTPTGAPSHGRSRGIPITIVAIVVILAVVVVTVMKLTASHSIRLPSSAAGFDEAKNLPASYQDTIHSMEDQLGAKHLHDVTARLYGDPNGQQGMLIVAAHINGLMDSMATGEQKFRDAAATEGDGLVVNMVSSGSTSYLCMWQPTGAQVTICLWWNQRAFLFGNGFGVDAQSTADALEDARIYAGLN